MFVNNRYPYNSETESFSAKSVLWFHGFICELEKLCSNILPNLSVRFPAMNIAALLAELRHERHRFNLFKTDYSYIEVGT